MDFLFPILNTTAVSGDESTPSDRDFQDATAGSGAVTFCVVA
jgi:hypothetical protein